MKKIVFLFILLLILSATLISYSKDKAIEVIKINGDNAYSQVVSYTETSESYTNNIIRFEFEKAELLFNKMEYISDQADATYEYTLEIPGNQIDIFYVNDEELENNNKVTEISSYQNLPKKTLYISTDLANLIVSVPTVYEKERIYDSIQTNKDYEYPIKITHSDNVYYVTYKFPKNPSYYSEFFYLMSEVPLLAMTSDVKSLLVRNELSGRFRLISDGFYQISYETYYPTGEGNYFRNCANYIAAHYINYNNNVNLEEQVLFFDYMSYASTYLADSQISEYGFFETKSMSDWLYKDFGIEQDFYDTRFNSDNGELNLLCYQRFGDEYFLNTAITYADFFVQYAKEHSYKTQNGILVEDYYNPKGGTRTHVSLNHHLANMNFLIELYSITNNQVYLDTAHLMLNGVEDTKEKWILEDNNLAYSLYYEGTNNVMKDYPYLTYNDLFIAKKRLNKLGISSQTIEDLMTAKKSYMDENGITGYYK